MRSFWKFVLLNIVALAGIVGALFLVPETTSLISFFGISAIVIAYLNYSLAVLPRLSNRTGSEEIRRRAWRDLRSTAVMAAIWAYLITWTPIGRVVAAATIIMGAVVAFVIWIAKKSAGPE
jgi:hypothetical protein